MPTTDTPAKGPVRFEGILSHLKDILVDLSQLNVRTYVGSIGAVFNDTNTDWNDILTKARSSGAISLVAVTTMSLDGDCDYFEDPTKITDNLRAAHAASVASGINARKAIVEFVAAQAKIALG